MDLVDALKTSATYSGSWQRGSYLKIKEKPLHLILSLPSMFPDSVFTLGAATAISKFECLVNFTEFKLSTSLTVEYSFRPNFPIPKIKIIFAASGHYLNLHDIMTNQPKWKHFPLASKKVQKEYRIWKESLSLHVHIHWHLIG